MRLRDSSDRNNRKLAIFALLMGCMPLTIFLNHKRPYFHEFTNTLEFGNVSKENSVDAYEQSRWKHEVRVALLSVGQPRGILEETTVHNSFELLLSSIKGQVDTFLALVEDGTFVDERHIQKLYNAKKVIVFDSMKPKSCGVLSVSNFPGRASREARLLRMVTMALHFRAGYALIEEWELSHDIRYDFIFKVRPDLVYFRPFPDETLLRGSKFIPRGVMTSDPRYQDQNDHIFVCRREQCHSYFNNLPDIWDNCSGLPSTSLEAQRLIFGGASALQENTFMYLPYTIIRSSGIDCKRLNCCENPSCTGCVAPHLVAFYKQCLQMNLLYKASPTIAKNRTKANLSVSKFTHR